MKEKKKIETKAVIVNIKWSDKHYFRDHKREPSYPEAMDITIPPRIMEQKDRPDFYDIVENFVYNLLSTLHGRCVTYCQTWLYDEEVTD